jgi:ubiquinone/menaquinone biosynthesis C-methylase UbiE|tara:strand:+ start:3595 stop:4269 length:675 start_codon:yes stop_codon:yes gene_type:complete
MNQIETEFNALASIYESNRLSSWYKAHAALVLNACTEHTNGKILDIGCGTGYLLRKLCQQNPRSLGVGIDIAHNMVREARNKATSDNIENVRFITGDWEEIDPSLHFKDNFNLILCSSSFHYFSRPLQSIEKIHALLAPGGVFILLERDKTQSLLTLVWDLVHRYLIKDHVVFYNESGLTDLCSKAGFDDVRVVERIKRYFWMNKFFTSLSLIQGIKQDTRGKF